MSTLLLRPATSDDAKMLFEWANDPLVRESAVSQEPIEWESHVAWLEKKLSNDACVMFIAEDADTAIGQIRFDCEEAKAEIDVHLAPEQRGKGYGSLLITEGAKKLFAETDITTIDALVKEENEASKKAFLKSAFQEVGMKDDLIHLQLLA
ncbi:MAG: GNAT family N-acetyltransferase [Flammeovirgaceae bacterium]|nr:GNAT family N-acetyltransferase [Flammeovirgaceae bacterium]|tara:strand:+ start:1063 stop:1515 length:453 start_codon:yes stop_codon:yes gene_type:complete